MAEKISELSGEAREKRVAELKAKMQAAAKKAQAEHKAGAAPAAAPKAAAPARGAVHHHGGRLAGADLAEQVAQVVAGGPGTKVADVKLLVHSFVSARLLHAECLFSHGRISTIGVGCTTDMVQCS